MRGILGFKEIWRGGGNPAVLSWTNMKVPDGDDYIRIHALQGPSRTHGARFGASLVPRSSARLGEAIQTLAKSPYAATYTRPMEERIGVNRKRQCNLYDPDGTRTELMEPLTIDTIPAPSSKAPPPR